MWKLALGFVVFAIAALFVLKKAGGDIDMSGEKHGTESSHEAPAASAAVPAAPAASAAPAPASAASS
jgi:hypothetical protein